MHGSRVLVLNASYEPLQFMPVHNAVRLVLREKAEVLETSEGQLRSARCTLDRPLVIRLHRYVRMPYQRVPCTRRAVLLRDAFTCQYCGTQLPANQLTLDHVLPRSRGGTTSWENVVAACRPCNSRKGDQLMHEARMQLRLAPAQPSRATMLRLALAAHPQWQVYGH